MINGDEPRIQLSAAPAGLPVYLSIGIEHLVFGFDHVLFVIMLLYIVRNPLDILKVVTSFTAAHSLTLALSAFDLLTLPSAPVEAVIAGSIVLLAYENLSDNPSLTSQYPVIIAFIFGLLHGLGFAGALAEIGLPENSRLWPFSVQRRHRTRSTGHHRPGSGATDRYANTKSSTASQFSPVHDRRHRQLLVHGA